MQRPSHNSQRLTNAAPSTAVNLITPHGREGPHTGPATHGPRCPATVGPNTTPPSENPARCLRTGRAQIFAVDAGTGMRPDDSRPRFRGLPRTSPSARQDRENPPGQPRALPGRAVRERARLSSPDIRRPITPCGSTPTENARCTPPDSGSAHNPTMKNTIGAQQWVSLFVSTCPSRKDCLRALLSSTKPPAPRCLP